MHFGNKKSYEKYFQMQLIILEISFNDFET